MSVKLVPKGDGSIELQNGSGTPLLTFDSLGNGGFSGELSDQDGRLGFGVGQTWQNFTASRSAGVTYTNTTGKPIVVSITGSSGTGVRITLTVDGLEVMRNGNIDPSDAAEYAGVVAIVPNASEYSFGVPNGTVSVLELR